MLCARLFINHLYDAKHVSFFIHKEENIVIDLIAKKKKQSAFVHLFWLSHSLTWKVESAMAMNIERCLWMNFMRSPHPAFDGFDKISNEVDDFAGWTLE